MNTDDQFALAGFHAELQNINEYCAQTNTYIDSINAAIASHRVARYFTSLNHEAAHIHALNTLRGNIANWYMESHHVHAQPFAKLFRVGPDLTTSVDHSFCVFAYYKQLQIEFSVEKATSIFYERSMSAIAGLLNLHRHNPRTMRTVGGEMRLMCNADIDTDKYTNSDRKYTLGVWSRSNIQQGLDAMEMLPELASIEGLRADINDIRAWTRRDWGRYASRDRIGFGDNQLGVILFSSQFEWRFSYALAEQLNILLSEHFFESNSVVSGLANVS